MDYYLNSSLGDREGIGDFLVKFPCIDYYTLDLKENLYVSTQKRFDCLLPKRDNLFISNHNTCNIPFDKTNHPYHPSAGWVPRIPKFEGNFIRKEPFYYPVIETSREVEQDLSNKFKDKIITFTKITAHQPRNWEEEKWNNLINILSKDFLCIDVGSKNSSKNSDSHIITKNSINVGDDLNLYQLAHLIKISQAFISPDTGFFHLATAVKCKKVIVLIKNGDFSWVYPNNIVYDISNNQDPTDKILKTIYG